MAFVSQSTSYEVHLDAETIPVDVRYPIWEKQKMSLQKFRSVLFIPEEHCAESKQSTGNILFMVSTVGSSSILDVPVWDPFATAYAFPPITPSSSLMHSIEKLKLPLNHSNIECGEPRTNRSTPIHTEQEMKLRKHLPKMKANRNSICTDI